MPETLPPIIYSAPLRELAAELHAEAGRLLERGITEPASWLADSARRMDERLAAASVPEYVSTADVAALRGVSLDAVAAQCRRRWFRMGKARKRGGTWEVHVSVLPGYGAAA